MAGNCTNYTKIDMMRINFKQVVKKGCVNMKKNQHITQREDGKWQVKGEGNEKATRITDTQKEAINIGREIARNQESELLIHGENGKIREKNSYGNDPYPPKG
jgi:hypothetical protein